MGIDGSDFRWIETDGEAGEAVFLPPAGETLVYVSGSTLGNGGQAVISLDVDSGERTVLVPSQPYGQIIGAPTVSPDGSRLAYSLWVSSGPAASAARLYTMPTDGSAAPVLVPAPPTICCEGRPAWSNDGARLAFQRIYDGMSVVAIVSVDEGGKGIEYRLPASTPDASVAWSPDDRYLLVTLYADIEGEPAGHLVLDATTGTPVPTQGDAAGPGSWQRLAP